MRPCLRASAALALAIVARPAGCATKSIKHRDWFYLETASFRIYSTYGVAGTRALAADLEAFRSAAVFVTGRPETPRQKTRVLAFDDRGVTRPFSFESEPGYYLPSLRGGTLVLRTNSGWAGDGTLRLRHEYAHDLLRNRVGLRLPLWLDEGVAQYVSTIEVRGHRASVGALRADHITLLRERLGVDAVDLLTRRSRLDLTRGAEERFEAATWALVHWLIGRHGRGDPAWLRARMEVYVAERRRGRPPTDAFENAFGVTVAQVDDELPKYVKGDQFVGVPLTFSPLPKQLVAKPVPRADGLAELGWLAVELGRAGTAKKHFEWALEADPRHTRAVAGLGAVARLEQDWALGDRSFDYALRADDADATVWLEAGLYHVARAAAHTDAAARRDSLVLARDAYRRSLSLDDALPDTHARSGTSYLVPGEDAREGLPELRRALALQPSSLEALLLRARLEVAAGDERAAHGTAERVHARTHDRAQAQAALEIIEAYSKGRTLIGR